MGRNIVSYVFGAAWAGLQVDLRFRPFDDGRIQRCFGACISLEGCAGRSIIVQGVTESASSVAVSERAFLYRTDRLLEISLTPESLYIVPIHGIEICREGLTLAAKCASGGQLLESVS